jgi:hypothetical protein
MNWFKLGGFIILRSSENCYHVVLIGLFRGKKMLRLWLGLFTYETSEINRLVHFAMCKERITIEGFT